MSVTVGGGEPVSDTSLHSSAASLLAPSTGQAVSTHPATDPAGLLGGADEPARPLTKLRAIVNADRADNLSVWRLHIGQGKSEVPLWNGDRRLSSTARSLPCYARPFLVMLAHATRR